MEKTTTGETGTGGTGRTTNINTGDTPEMGGVSKLGFDIRGELQPRSSRPWYTFDPREDITAYELALCIANLDIRQSYPPPESVMRHFKRIDP